MKYRIKVDLFCCSSVGYRHVTTLSITADNDADALKQAETEMCKIYDPTDLDFTIL